MQYDDFVLQLELRPGRGFRARVTRSPAGEGSEDVELAHLTASLIDLAAGEAGSPHRGRPPGGPSRNLAGDEEAPDPLAGDPRQVGALLFDQLIRGRVRSLFDQSLGALRNQSGRGLRLKLKFDPHVPELARLGELPWELLYREETHDFVALDRTTPLVRYLDVPRPTQPIPLPEELSILVAISSPRDLPALNLEREFEKLDEIWKHQRGLKTRTLKRPSSASLRAALLEEPCHVLHFMGHGDFDPHSGEGVLFFETEDGLSEAVSGQALATKLKDRRELGLVFLNACNTAASSSREVSPFGGVASALVLGGLPAVLAMQRPITDKAAIRFSQTFYHRLAAGDPVDTAVTEGRQAIDTGDASAREWAIPALFVRVHDGTVFSRGADGHPAGPPVSRARPTKRFKLLVTLITSLLGTAGLALGVWRYLPLEAVPAPATNNGSNGDRQAEPKRTESEPAKDPTLLVAPTSRFSAGGLNVEITGNRSFLNAIRDALQRGAPTSINGARPTLRLTLSSPSRQPVDQGGQTWTSCRLTASGSISRNGASQSLGPAAGTGFHTFADGACEDAAIALVENVLYQVGNHL